MMNKKIAFICHKTRGQEIIKILEGMGGVNKYNLDGSKGIIAIETNIRGNYITNDWDYLGLLELGYEVYTLETWEEKNNSVLTKTVNLDDVCEWIQKNMKKYVKNETSRGENGEIEFTIITHSVDMVRDLRKAMEK